MPDPREARRAIDKLAHEQQPWMTYRNDASESVPPYGVMRITGASYNTTDKLTFITIAKPNTTFQRSYAINGPSLVPAGKYGACTFGFGQPLMVAYDTGTPAYGEGWGAKPDSWKLNKNYGAGNFVIVGGNNTTKGTTLAVQHLVTSFIGKLNGSLAQGGSAAVSVWRGTAGSEADETGMDVTAYDWLLASGADAIASGKKVVVTYINGIAYVTEAECA